MRRYILTCCQWILSHSWCGGELICMPECVLRFPSTRSSPTRVLAYACFLRSGGYGLGKTSIATVSVAKEGMFSGTTLSLPHFCLDQCHFAPTSQRTWVCTFVSTGNRLRAKKKRRTIFETDFGVKLRGGVWSLHVSPRWGWGLGQVLVVFPFGARFARLAEMAWEADSQHQLRI